MDDAFIEGKGMTVESLTSVKKYESTVYIIHCPKCGWPHPFVRLEPPLHCMSLLPNNEGFERFCSTHPTTEKVDKESIPCNKCGTLFCMRFQEGE